MSQAIKKSMALLLIKMAQADGEIDALEHSLLQEFIGEEVVVESLTSEVEKTNLETLAKSITSPADRFFMRVRCQLMAWADGELASEEAGLLEEIVKLLPLSKELETLLGEVLDHELDNAPEPDLQKIEALYLQSSLV